MKESQIAVMEEILFIKAEGLSAKGVVTTKGFAVLAESIVNEKTSTKSLSSGVVKLREKMFKDGKIDNLKTTEEVLFSSSSAAAGFLLGYSVSGPGTWKNSSQITLKDLENN